MKFTAEGRYPDGEYREETLQTPPLNVSRVVGVARVTLDSGVELRLRENVDGELEVIVERGPSDHPYRSTLAVIGHASNVTKLRVVSY